MVCGLGFTGVRSRIDTLLTVSAFSWVGIFEVMDCLRSARARMGHFSRRVVSVPLPLARARA